MAITSHSNFFGKRSGAAGFKSKFRAAMKLIKANESLVAANVLEVLQSGKVEIRSFYKLKRGHYHYLKNEFRSEKINLGSFPPSPAEVKEIESRVEGIIFDNKSIYISSSKSTSEMASTIIHEVGHFINSSLSDKQSEKNVHVARYSDEVRSFTAEKMFERNGHCLTRSAIRDIHEMVTDLYPEFHDPKATAALGYIYGVYDMPSDEMDLSP